MALTPVSSLSAGGVRVVVQWDRPKIAYITGAWPVAAHNAAAAAAAGAAARAIKSRETGALARDVGVPKPVGTLSAVVGSSLPYARIQDQGGRITPKNFPRLYIHGTGIEAPAGVFDPGGRYEFYAGGPTRREPAGTPGGGRYASFSDIVATADEVEIRPKHYLAWAPPTYEMVLLQLLRSTFPP